MIESAAGTVASSLSPVDSVSALMEGAKPGHTVQFGSSSCDDVESGRRLLNFDNHQLLPPESSSPDNDMMEFSDSSGSSNNSSTRPIEATTTTTTILARWDE